MKNPPTSPSTASASETSIAKSGTGSEAKTSSQSGAIAPPATGPPVHEPAPGSAADPLAPLVVWDRLEVGPVRIEPRKLDACYRVVRGEQVDFIDLSYRWEEDVFDPEDSASQNLANLIAAQVALNYGLFCRKMVFHGTFDRVDRQFLREMARNTAREIYVKKFLEPNPFLRGEAASLPAVRRNHYLAARLVFSPASATPTAPSGGDVSISEAKSIPPMGTQSWSGDEERYCVLSSGGKDSLLSYGLLQELGCPAYSFFVNESGRHWWTALNAYRHFQANVPGTGRVWTNSDRIFAWMLRQLPFVRQDFANVRSDEYPIRLWTVAVFLFGVLPLLRRHRIGTLAIGDEFDTTVRQVHRGITHYNGLYDQSRYFDSALTRFYHRKGWNVVQLSLLRPLSEMLIQKLLVERYPELQQHQVSCHATHKEGDKVRPCGQCEKCRRIVGMLLAHGAAPQGCGYTPEQIARCREDLVRKGVHQEEPATRHLGHLLHERGEISEPRLGAVAARSTPQALKLRFDPDKAPVDGIPRKLREGLYRIYVEAAEGALLRQGRAWKAFDPMDAEVLSRPFPFERSIPPSQVHASAGTSGYLVSEMTWPQARRRFAEVDLALLPVGAIEQHGPHLPLDTDAFDADYLCRRVAEACSDPRPLVLPLIPYGVSYHHEDFAGTLSISNETLSRLVYEIGMDVARQGIKKLLIINGHGGNAPALQFAAQQINRDGHIFTCVDTGETSDADVEALAETPGDVHAGEIETSTSLFNRPHLVRLDQAESFVPDFSSHYLQFSSVRSVEWYARTAKISESGVMGDPSRATREKGEKMWEVMVRHLVQLVEDLKRLSLDEIHQRKH